VVECSSFFEENTLDLAMVLLSVEMNSQCLHAADDKGANFSVKA